MKKILTTIFAMLLIGGALMQSALAQGDILIAPAPTADVVIEPAYTEVSGTIQNIDAAGKTITILAPEGLLSIRVENSARILDNATQKPAAFGDFKLGGTIRAWYDSVQPSSYLPIAGARVIVTGINKDDPAIGDYFEVEKVEKTKYGYKLLNQEQDLYFTVPKDVKIPVVGTDKTIRPSSIKPGTKLVVWYEVVALSFPGQTGSSKLVALPYDYAGYVSLIGDKIAVNGSKLSLKACETCATYMIPMKAVADKLGIKTKWDKTARTLTLTKGSKSVVMTAGEDELIFNGKSVETVAPVLQSGRLYAQMSVLSLLGNYKLANPIR
ncbi:MAG: copper amine oxidase N-terminal domain-containing protein [Bacillota bacterium]